ncbi:uncharacterized protein METZ01_LOCUS506177, partial [marine metagenome]
MKQMLVILAAVVLVGCGNKKEVTGTGENNSNTAKAKATPKAEPKGDLTPKAEAKAGTTPKTQPKVEAKNPQPSKAIPANIDDPILEKAIREELNKPTGELTQVDLEKVYNLDLYEKQLTELPKGLEKLTQLERLSLWNNQLT